MAHGREHPGERATPPAPTCELQNIKCHASYSSGGQFKLESCANFWSYCEPLLTNFGKAGATWVSGTTAAAARLRPCRQAAPWRLHRTVATRLAPMQAYNVAPVNGKVVTPKLCYYSKQSTCSGGKKDHILVQVGPRSNASRPSCPRHRILSPCLA